MKHSMSTRGAGLALAAAILATASVAGPRYSDPGVTVTRYSDGSGRAYGTLGGTRNSAYSRERLSCSVSRTSVMSAAGAEAKLTTLSCTAVDRNGVTASCVSLSEQYADILSGLANDGLVEFGFSATGQCTSLAVYESSSLERKR